MASRPSLRFNRTNKNKNESNKNRKILIVHPRPKPIKFFLSSLLVLLILVFWPFRLQKWNHFLDDAYAMKVPEPGPGSRTLTGSKLAGSSTQKGSRTFLKGLNPKTIGHRRTSTVFQNQFWVKLSRSGFGTNPNETRRKVVRNGHPICYFEF